MNNTTIQIHDRLSSLPSLAKRFLITFILVMSFGYGTGLYYLNKESGMSVSGVEEQYLGNEDDLMAEEMKFKMSEKALLTLVHGHVISFSFIFFSIGVIFLFSSYSNTIKHWLIIEPMISVATTFGGVWLMWLGFDWLKYVVILSGSLMHLSFAILVILSLKDLLRN